MPYAPPAGNAVNFNFSGAYTPPLGNAVNLNFLPGGFTFNLDPGTYVLTGTNLNLRFGRRFILAGGSYAISGTALLSFRGYAIVATPGVYAVTGAPVSLTASRYLSAVPGVYAVSGSPVGLRFGRRLTAAAGVYALSGSAISLRFGRRIGVTPGVYAISSAGLELLWKHILRATPGVYTQVRTDVSLRFGRRINVTPGVYELSGKSLIFTYHEVTKIVAVEGVYTLTGSDVTFIYDRRLTTTPGSYLIQGHAPQLVASRRLAAAPGSYAISGVDVVMSQGGRTLGADSGLYRLVGGNATMTVTRRMSLVSGAYVVAGTATQLLAARRLALGSGVYSITDTPNFSSNFINNSLLTNDDGEWYFGDIYGIARNADRVATGDPLRPFAFQQTDPHQNLFLRWSQPYLLIPDYLTEITLSFEVKPGAVGQEFVFFVAWYKPGNAGYLSGGGILVFAPDPTKFTKFTAVVQRPPEAVYFNFEVYGNPDLGVVGYAGNVRAETFAPMSATTTRLLPMVSGAYSLTGQELTFRRQYNIHVTPGVYSLNGVPISLLADRLMDVGSRAFQIVWTPAQVVYHRTPPGPRALAPGVAPNRTQVVV